MAFSTNPLSLNVPDHHFESWLRDTGYLEVLDHRHSSTSSAVAAATSSSDENPSGSSSSSSSLAVASGGIFISIFAKLATLLSLLTLNPLAKLTADDFSGQTPSWTSGFIGCYGSYSFPSSGSQARLRVHENVKRYARNYACLFILSLACTLYQIPLALIGVISSLALWDLFKFCGDKWGLDSYPITREILVRVAQCDMALWMSNLGGGRHLKPCWCFV
ncbi:hypothetical protein ACFE04_024416 [Oxalis oulophora]